MDQQYPNQQQVPPQQPQPVQQQPMPQQPVYTQPAAYTAQFGLTGGQKFGWVVIGMCMGIAGILLAWLTNLNDNAVRSDAIKFSVIGLVINIVFVFLIFASVGCSTAALIGSTANYYSY